MNNELVWIIVFILSSLISGFVIKFSRALGWVDVPNDRSSHSAHSPTGGGLGILAAFVFISVVAGIPAVFWIPACCISILGLLADISEIRAKPRLAAQFFLSAALLGGFWTGLAAESARWTTHFPWALWFAPTMLFLVASANFVNFIDGIDGITGISGAVAFAFLAYVSRDAQAAAEYFVVCVGLCLACVGFLPWNFPKSRLFMGDVGSTFLGFVFASLVIYLAVDPADLFCYAGFLFPSYADVFVTMYERWRNKESLLCAHRKHLYQVLANELKIPHWKISVGFGSAQILVGVCLLLMRPYGLAPVVGFLAVALAGFVVFSGKIKKGRVY